MRILALLTALYATALAATDLIDSTIISIQAVSTTPQPPTVLAEIQYNPSTLSASLSSYSPPDLSLASQLQLYRVGVYDEANEQWKSATSSVSVATFEKGIRQTIVLNLDGQGGVLGVGVKGAVIDAGTSREFGPQVRVRGMGKSRPVVLNQPVKLSVEGKVEGEVVEKTLLQK